MRIFAALLTAFLLVFSQEGWAQTEPPSAEATDPETVHAAFVKLVDRGEARALFGLPEETFWRRSGGLKVALLAEDPAASIGALGRVAALFSKASGEEISIAATGAPPQPRQRLTTVVPQADLLIIIGPRAALAEIALAEGLNKGMMARFELGTWPFMFSFVKGPTRRGVVLLADDEPPRAREASFILATVWALGGVTLGPELTGLISNDDAAGPGLTPLGQAVFALLFNEELKNGMAIPDAVLRAKTLLAE